jgi:hypothetical protein
MPLPGIAIIQMAKSYAYQSERIGAAAAREDLLERYPYATRRQIDSAINQAQRATAVGTELERLRLEAEQRPDLWERQVREALGVRRAPAQRVGVRVDISAGKLSGTGYTQEYYNTLYIEVSWNDTLEVVRERVEAYIGQLESRYRRDLGFSWEFSGPSLWPGQSTVLD